MSSRNSKINFQHNEFMLFVTEWPWGKSEMLRNLSDWMFLPGVDSSQDSYKLLCKSITYYIIFNW